MELAAIASVLSRHRRSVFVGVLLAIAVSLLAAFRVSLFPPGLQSRQVQTAIATQSVLVDTPNSLRADARARGSTTIDARSVILASHLAGDRPRNRIAGELGVDPLLVGIAGPEFDGPAALTELATAVRSTVKPREPYALTVTPVPQLPILKLSASAPSTERAVGMLDAATAALRALAAREVERGAEQAIIHPVGEAQTDVVTTGPGKALGAGIGLAVLVLWCATIVLLDSLGRFLRRPRPAARVVRSRG